MANIESGTTLFIAVVTHDHGDNVYASDNQERVMDALLEYCRDWWHEEGVPGEPDTDIVTRYFAHVDGRESYTIAETEAL